MKISDDREHREALVKKLNDLLVDIERDRERIAKVKGELGTALGAARDRLFEYSSTMHALAKRIPTFDALPTLDELVKTVKPVGLTEQLDEVNAALDAAGGGAE